MAVTRIKTNQITDSSVTNAKIADYSIQGGKLANSFTYGSDLTVSGNLTVNGTTTTVDTVQTTIDDPILLLGSNQTGSGSVDLGILGERGDDTNVFMGYDESADEFVMALTSTSDSNSAVTITDYVTTHVGGLTADDAVTATGNVTGGNLTTAGAVTATGNITGGNLVTGGDAVVTGDATVTGNVAGNNITWTTRLSSSDNNADIYMTDNLGRYSQLSSGSLTSGASNGVSRSTMYSTGQIYSKTASGNVDIANGNVTADGTVSATTLTGTLSTASQTNVTEVGTLSYLDVTGNITGGNLAVGTELTAGTMVAEDLTSGRVVLAGTGGAIEDSTNLTFDGSTLSVTGAMTASGNVTGGNLVTSGKFDNGTLDITGGNISTGSTTTLQSNGGMSDSKISAGTNVITLQVDGGDIEFRDGAISGAGVNYLTIGKGTGNVVELDTTSDGGIELNTYFTATGNITGGNLTTAGLTSTATLSTSGAATLGGTLDVTGNTTVANFTVDASSTLEFNENVLGNIGTPVASSDATTKAYVDNLLSSGFTVADSANNTQTISQGDTVTFNGTTNEIEVSVSATDTITVGLPNDVEITNNLTVGGNLIVQGSQTIVDATSTSIVDPIIQLGRGANNAALTSNDGKDRGVAMYYYNGAEKVAYLGWDDPSNEFRFIPDATISSESVTGSLGTANLGKVRVDSIDIDSNSITTTSGNLELSAAGASHVKVPTGNELVIEDISDTHIVYSNSGQLEGGSGLTYDGTELYADNMYSGGYLNVDGTANVANLEVAGSSTLDGALTVGTTATVTGNVTGGNLITAGLASVTGNVTGGNLITAGLASVTGNVTGGNLVTSGKFDNGTLEISGGNISTGNTTKIQSNGGMGDSQLVATNNAIYLQNDGGDVEFRSGAISGAGTKYLAIGKGTGNIVEFDTLSDGGIELNTYFTATGNITGGNLTTAGHTSTATITATGNITGGNLVTGGDAVVTGDGTFTGNVAGNNITWSTRLSNDNTSADFRLAGTSGTVYADNSGLKVMSSDETTSRIELETSNGQIDSISSSGNVTIASGAVTAAGTVTGGTLTDGTMSVSSGAVTGVTSLVVDNITIDGDDITTSGSALTINDAGSDVDFRVEGSTNANLLVVDAGSDSVSIGTATQTANVTFKVGSTDSMMVPVGTTAERPSVGVAGMIRYNSTTDQYEAYDVSESQFKGLGVPAFTVIASESFDGDGSTTGFTLSDEQTTASCIISINGVVQLPTTAYSVSGNAITFTEAPETGDKIEVRKLTTTSTIASLSNGDQSVTIETGDSQVDITGDVVITGNLTFSGQNFLGQYNHSNVYVASSSDETNNTGSTLAITAGTLGFNLTQASYYQVFLNRQLLRPDEITVNLTNGTITFASDTLAANDEIEAVFLAT